VLGALLMRGAMIAAGAYLIARFHCILYVFGGFLIVTAIRMATQDEHAIEPEANPVIRLLRRVVPVTDVYHGQRFFVREQAQWMATPLLIVLVFVELTDLVFAVDSIPQFLP
jgi:tellurite resistance protein TerC